MPSILNCPKFDRLVKHPLECILFKKMQHKEKMTVTSICSIAQNIFYPIKENCAICTTMKLYASGPKERILVTSIFNKVFYSIKEILRHFSHTETVLCISFLFGLALNSVWYRVNKCVCETLMPPQWPFFRKM